jgi:U4/U6.U5 tri-snRNP-associated protein 2
MRPLVLVVPQDEAVSAENARHTGGAEQQRNAEWLEIQDLFVKRAESETLFTREGYLMVWERRKTPAQKVKGSAK